MEIEELKKRRENCEKWIETTPELIQFWNKELEVYDELISYKEQMRSAEEIRKRLIEISDMENSYSILNKQEETHELAMQLLSLRWVLKEAD